MKACRGADVWKLLNVVWDSFGACLKAVVMQNGRFRMNAIVGVCVKVVALEENRRRRLSKL